MTVSQAGTLAQLLDELGLKDARQLTISGPLNSQDIRTIRHLCGGHDEDPRGEVYQETLQVLDLSDAHIVEGEKNVFYYNDLQGEISPNRYINVKNQIGWYMFANTTSLEEVTLPRSVEIIQAAAFIHSRVQRVYISEGTQTVRKYAFSDCPQLEFVGIASSVNELDVCTFSQCPSLSVVRCEATTPPRANEDPADDTTSSDMSQCELIVPAGCSGLYSTADFWKNFKTVTEETSAIEHISNTSATAADAVYGIDGSRRDGISRGLNIIKRQDGSSIKVVF